MSIMCCNSVVEHRYCPFCGKDNTMVKDEAYALLGHCRLMAKTMKTRANHMMSDLERRKNEGLSEDALAYYRERLLSMEEAATKWSNWAMRLELLMNNEGIDM